MEEKPLSHAHAETVTLVLNWAALMALSLILAFAADIVGASRPGAVWIVRHRRRGGVQVAHRAAHLSRPRQARPARSPAFSPSPWRLLGLVAVSVVIFPTPKIFLTPKAASGPQADPKFSHPQPEQLNE